MSSIQLLGARVNDSGQIVFSPEAAPRKAFFEDFFTTPEGKAFLPYNTATARSRIAEIAEKWYPGDTEITVPKFCSVVRALLDSRDPAVVPPPEVQPTPAADDRQRHADGRFKSEFEIYADTHSVSDARSRANVDRAFGDWWRAQYASQTVQQGVFKVLGDAPERSATQADRSLLETFALAYSRTSMDAIRKPIAGYVTLSDGSRYTVAELRTKVEAAAKVGLI